MKKMTRINKILIHGFKSFAHKTEILFDKDFNAVIGPNGSGKSNISDAVCFVLGKLSSKSLRVEKAANLIYNGGKTKKPMQQAEVSIYFDNSKKIFPYQDDEIKITRIIKQNGQSTYKINNKRVTRNQVIDLLSIAKIDPEGYNIILQGDIAKFTEMKPEDRRKIIEEISGIAVYEDKKQKALSELAKVDEKLKEAEIILTERRTHLNELKRDRDQALRFKQIEEKLKSAKATLIHLRLEAKKKELEKINKRVEEEDQKLQKIQDKITSIKKEIEKNQEKINSINKEIEQKGEKEQINLHKQLEQLKITSTKKKEKIAYYKNQLLSIERRRESLKKEQKNYEEQIKKLTQEQDSLLNEKKKIISEHSDIKNKLQALKRKHGLDATSNIEEKLSAIDKELDKLIQQVQSLREKQQDLIRKKDAIQFQISTIDEKIEKVKKVEKENEEQIKELKHLKATLSDLTKELNSCIERDSFLARKLKQLNNQLQAKQTELAKLKAKAVELRETTISNIAIEKILKQKEKIRGVHGILTELGSVDERYALALEIAAGPRAKSIVVETDKVAADCIKFLKKNKYGVATFIPLNKIKGKQIPSGIKKEKGVIGPAIELIDFDPKYKKAFSYVFGDTLVVDNIDTARKIGIGKIKMVTLDGDLCETSGVMQGGSRKKGKGLFAASELKKKISTAEKETVSIEQEKNDIERARILNEEKISNLRKKISEHEAAIIKLERTLHLESEDLNASLELKEKLRKDENTLQNQITAIQEEITTLTKKIAALKSEKNQLREKLAEIRSPALIATISTFEEQERKLNEKLLKINNEINNIKSKIDDILIPESKKIQKILLQQEKEEKEIKEKIKELTSAIKRETEEIKEKEKSIKRFYSSYKSLFTERDKLSDQLQNLEEKIETERERAKQIEIKLNEIKLKRAEINASIAGIEKEFEEYKGVLLLSERSIDALKHKISSYEKELASIGTINMRALEIYEQVELEFNRLIEKKTKLLQEREEVLKIMQEIESKKKNKFMKTFATLNKQFKRIFSELATKGEASLVLENIENPFDAGVDIKVRITGSRFLDIRSLSGGEKTLTALAFIFAIQEYEPHSFYLFDEVDAALDKRNSELLAKLIKKYSKNAQYIVITHNDSIISEADNLFGVSMNEEGISKIVSLRL